MDPKSPKSNKTSSAMAANFENSCLIAVRVCLLAIALLSTTAYSIYYNVGQDSVAFFLYKPIALFFGFCALSGLWLAWQKTSSVFIYLQFIADAAFITAVVWITGGSISPFLFLYIPLIIGAALLSNRNVALAIAFISFCLYTTLIFLLELKILEPFYLNQGLNEPKHGYILQLIGLGSSMILTAVGAGYLRKVLRAGHSQAIKSKQDLETLEQQQRTLVEELSEGIVSTNHAEIITHVNQSALSLLQLPLEECLEKKLSLVLENAFPSTTFEINPKNQSGQQNEVNIKRPTGEDLHLVYLVKPIINEHGEQTGSLYIFQDVTRLRDIEEQLQWQVQLQDIETNAHISAENCYPSLPEFVGESSVMKKIFRLIQRVAASDASILISGESGTGKELVAKAVHVGSDRAKFPFVAVNCGAIPENLIESQLFGHKRGSFTSADADHHGYFEQANNGTIFLDEIGELPLQMQTKLLRVLQERVIRPIGSEQDRPVNVRVISATNKNIKQELEEGKFREDLFYRLNVINLSLPPLRDRKDDIPLLTHTILKKLKKEDLNPSMAPQTMKLLMDYSYPGNVRELENILERALVLGGEVILPEHLPENIHNPKRTDSNNVQKQETMIVIDESIDLPINLDELLSNIERRYLEVALLKSNGIKKQAANLLGINFRSLRYRLQKFDMGD